MSETADASVQISAEQTNTEVLNIQNDPFGKNAWSENAPEIKPEEKTDIKPEVKQDEPAKVEVKTDTVVEPFYKKIGFEKEEDVITEINTLREKNSKGFEYKNDESRKIAEYINEGKEDELYKYLDTKKKVQKLSTSDLSDKAIAAELVKFGIHRDNPNLQDDEVEFLFNEKYSLPDKPIQGDDLDDEYEVKVNNWKKQVESVEKRLVIEAKMQQPKMAQLNQEIVLPEIKKQQEQTANELDPEVLKQIRANFLNKLESDFSKTEGFSTQVKDESVEIPVSFKIPDEDKLAIKGRLENNFDVDGFINNRWFGEDGEPKITQIVEDIYLLDNRDKVLSGIANNSANQRILEYRKQVNNTNINNNTNQNTFQPNQDGKANISPFSQEAWSDRPPVFQS